MRIMKIIFYLILIIIGVSFAVLNAETVQVHFYVTSITLPVSLLMTFALGIGILIGSLLFIGKYWRIKFENHKISNQVALLDKEIKNLRAIPLHDQH